MTVVTPAPIEVTAVVPFDGVTGILVPAGSILVSALIAIWLARGERRAADADRVGLAASRVVRSLSSMVTIVVSGDRAALQVAFAAFQGDVNEFSVSVDEADSGVPKYVALLFSRAVRTGDLTIVGDTAAFLIACIEGWVRRQITTSQFVDAMPPDTDGVWTSTARPEEWPSVLGIGEGRAATG